MESTMQFDMMDDLLDFLTPAPRPAGLDYEGTSGKVLLSPAGNWWLGDSHAISPQGELQQDSMWCDHADGSLSSPVGQYGEVQYMDDVGSPEKLWFHDDDLMSQYKPISDLSVSSPSSHGPLASPHGPLASPLGPLALSPMEVKFELSMLDQSLLEQPACYNVDVGSGLESLELSMPLSKTLLSLQDYQEPQDSTVSCSPLHDTTLVDLDAGEEDSLHEEEIVFQLLRELDSLSPNGLLKTSTTLLHVSPEEVESVLSRDSSYENLAALDEPTVSHRIQPMVSRQVESTVSRRVEPAVSHTTLLPVSRPTTLPTVLSTFIPSPPVSVASPVTILPFTIGSGYQQSSLISKIPASQAGLSAQPYSRAEVLVERRQRKKEQNKTAALRYRQKKREEKGHTTTEVEELEQQNAALRSRADELSKEINYLKGLLEEIRR